MRTLLPFEQMRTLLAVKAGLIATKVSFSGFGPGLFTGKGFKRFFTLILDTKFGVQRC